MIGNNLPPSFNADVWAKDLFNAFQKKMKRQKIGVSNNLYNSFKKHIFGNVNHPDKIELNYMMYGAFVDMGVGKGDNAANAKYNSSIRRLTGKDTHYKRRAKKWYNKTITSYQMLMADQISSDTGNQTVAKIKDSLPGKIEL